MAIGADLIFYLNVFLISHTRFWNIHQASAQSTRLTETNSRCYSNELEDETNNLQTHDRCDVRRRVSCARVALITKEVDPRYLAGRSVITTPFSHRNQVQCR